VLASARLYSFESKSFSSGPRYSSITREELKGATLTNPIQHLATTQLSQVKKK